MKSFEERLERLESLNQSLKKGCSLEEAVAFFEEGITLAKGLEKDLSKVERKVEMLTNAPEGKGEKPALELFPELNDQ